MQIVIIHSDKCKQVIRVTEEFTNKKSLDEMNKIANTIAHDISRNNHKLVNLQD